MKRKSYAFEGEPKTLKELAAISGIDPSALRFRIEQGWDLKKAVFLPTRKKGSKLNKTKEYRSWSHMKGRCYDRNDKFFHRYGGRGITVCERWNESFWYFLEDVGYAPTPKHTLDRIDNNRNYEPNNVRWATQKEQANNRSGKCLKLITFRGETKNLSEWATSLGLAKGTIYNRINNYGWSIVEALSHTKSNRGFRVKVHT